jgi:catechol 2,3-dioxygenase-like lactoylglutathione lyase family enzyme
MKRFHPHVGVDDLESSVRFYSTLFGAEPAVTQVRYVYGNDLAPRPRKARDSDSCCTPATNSTSACCSGSKAR